MEENSSSDRKAGTVFAAKKASVIGVKALMMVAFLALAIMVATMFAGSLKDVQALVEEGVVPKPLYTFVLSGICLALLPMIFKRMKL